MALALALIVAGCAPVSVATPIVIRDTSRAATLTAAARPSVTPSGPTLTPTLTSTPYARPTDSPALDLALPLAQVGAETITLGDFRARVRYERFAALDDVQRTVEIAGLAAVNFTTPGANPVADAIAGVFKTLASSEAFGIQVYDILIRESIIRQEFVARGLTLPESDVRGYWIRRFNLQREANPGQALEAPLTAYLERAARYSGLSAEAIRDVAESFVMATMLQPVIVKETVRAPGIVIYRMRWFTAPTQADADAAYAFLQNGGAFREMACRYDPSATTVNGDLGWKSRRDLTFSDAARIFEAEIGAVIGVFQDPLGWHLYRVNAKRRDPDGEAQARLQGITVAGEMLARQLLDRLTAAPDEFAQAACQYSLNEQFGEFTTLREEALPGAVAKVLSASNENKLFPPIQTDSGYALAEVQERTLDIPEPEDVAKAEAKAFRDWQTARAGSSYVRPLSEAWRQAIPEDPLPRQVAPFLTEETFGLPTPAPTPTP